MTEQPKTPSSRAEYLQRYAESWQQLEAQVATYDFRQLAIPTDAAGWNVRDHLGHLCAWQVSMIAFLHKEHEWDAIGLTREQFEVEDIDASNELIREMTINVSPGDVIEMLQESSQELFDLVESLPEKDLLQPATAFHPDWAHKSTNVTVLQVIYGDTASHFDEHRPWIERIVNG